MNPPPIPECIQRLSDADPKKRTQATRDLFTHGAARTLPWLDEWRKDPAFTRLLVRDAEDPGEKPGVAARLTTGIAVFLETFERIRAANGLPPLADVPPDQDAREFELRFSGDASTPARLDVLTSNAPGGTGAIARYLEKFGEGIQQIEIEVTDVDSATEIVRSRFHVPPVYPATRSGANGTRINFFLVATTDGKKVLVEFVEAASPE